MTADRDALAGWLLIATGLAVGFNGVVAALPNPALDAAVGDVYDRMYGDAAPSADALARLAPRFAIVGAVVAVLEAGAQLAVGIVLLARRGWARIAALVVSGIGLYSVAVAGVSILAAPDLAIPYVVFIGFGRDVGMMLTAASTVLLAVAYIGVILLMVMPRRAGSSLATAEGN